MRKFTTICLAAFIAVLFFARCNSEYNYPNENVSSSVAVYSFALTEDDSIMAHLDTVFFAIDLDKGTIFNADSLPYGTKVDKLVPRIRMLETVSQANLTVPANGSTEESVHDYLTNPGDTIDFTNPVYLDVKSPDGLVSRRYTITVNVHKLVSDSLVWDKAAFRTLPSSLAAVRAQRTASTADGLYCLTTDGSAWCIAYTAHAFAGDWEYAVPALPAGAVIESFNGSDDALYILAAGGALFRSTDGGKTWSDTSCRWSNIYGCVGDAVLGNVKTSSSWTYTCYPAGGCDGVAMPASMPVTGSSQLVDFTFPYSGETQAVMVGGEKADGSYTGAVWAYDGSTWAQLNGNFLKPLRGVTIMPFYAFRTSNTLVATEYSLIMAAGGVDEDDVVNDSIYVTTDYGLTWSKAADLMQLPDYVPPFYGAQAFIEETTLSSRASSGWTEMPFAYRLPAGAVLDGTYPSFSSRATAPVTSWDCPFIYLFGGYNRDGELYDTLWRATLNRLTFKPIQ